MKNTILILVFLLTSYLGHGQFIKDKAINIMVGYGLSNPYNNTNSAYGSGFYSQGELVLKVKSWIEIKPYFGLTLTNSSDETLEETPTNEEVETKAVLIGGKTRLRAPIPWVAPYLEIGIGSSIGKFKTQTEFYNIDKGGIIYHIPFAFGLELGRNNNFDLGFTYYFQPTVKQFTGAAAIGFTFKLNN